MTKKRTVALSAFPSAQSDDALRRSRGRSKEEGDRSNDEDVDET